MAFFAHLVAAHRHFRLGSEYCFFELQGDIFAQIGSALRTAATTAASSASAKKVTEAEEVAKDVAEILENGGVEPCRSRRRRAYASVPEAVIKSPLFLVSEDRVRLAALFEFLFCVRVIGIAVRMVLKREFPIRALDLDLGDRAAYPEDFVIITFAVGCRNESFPTIRARLELDVASYVSTASFMISDFLPPAPSPDAADDL